MTYRGRVKDGVVVFDDTSTPPEGTEVKIETVERTQKTRPSPTLSEILLKYAGTVQGLPPDASLNHDHYLYGTPKR
jgi:hypothetical protein